MRARTQAAYMAAIAEQHQLALFSERLPFRPYCTDDLAAGLRVLPLQAALERRYIQYNPPAMINWLAFDIDRPYVGFESEWRTVAPPNIVVVNPKNQHSHYLYGIAAGVCTTNAGRDKPRRLLSAIDEGYRHALDADPGFSRLICKNPLSAHWVVQLLREDLYDLSELAEYVDLDAADERIRKTPKKQRSGVGRNCSMFDSLRAWAYRWVKDYQTRGLDQWHEAVRDKAEKLNTFITPLPASEIRATARSVAKWTWSHYSGQMTAAGLEADGLTPSAFSLLQSNLGKLGNAKRWGQNDDKRAQAIQMRAADETVPAIAAALEVSERTVQRWTNGAGKGDIAYQGAGPDLLGADLQTGGVTSPIR